MEEKYTELAHSKSGEITLYLKDVTLGGTRTETSAKDKMILRFDAEKYAYCFTRTCPDFTSTITYVFSCELSTYQMRDLIDECKRQCVF